jgi:hypothetical protein
VLGEAILLKKTEERLSRHWATPGLGGLVQQPIVGPAARRGRTDTLIVVDPTDLRTPYAQAMPHRATVRDGRTGELVKGYWACVALASEPERRRVSPLLQPLWSAQAPDFERENTQLLAIIDTVARATDRREGYVLDRGGDRMRLYEPLLARGWRFIIRLRGDRPWVLRGCSRRADDLARGVRRRYAATVVREQAGGQKRVHWEYGFVRVRRPGRREVALNLGVVRGLGQEPWLLLTNVTIQPTRRSLWWGGRGYRTRWLVEETIRFIKQSYRLEDLRVLDYERLRNLAAGVMAAAYFAAVWLGESLKLAGLASRVSRLAKRFFGVPEFHYYAWADGSAGWLSRLGRWGPLCPPALIPATLSRQRLFPFW